MKLAIAMLCLVFAASSAWAARVARKAKKLVTPTDWRSTQTEGPPAGSARETTPASS